MYFTGIEYTMPLRNNSQLGYGISDSTFGKVEFFAYNVTTVPHQKKKFDEEDETEEKWLQSLGVEESEIRKIHNLQVLISIVILIYNTIEKNNFYCSNSLIINSLLIFKILLGLISYEIGH